LIFGGYCDFSSFGFTDGEGAAAFDISEDVALGYVVWLAALVAGVL
jgi:hypothetical protein